MIGELGETHFSKSPDRNVIQIIIIWVESHRLTVMNPSEPNPAYDPIETLLGWAILFGLVLVVLLAVSYPVAFAVVLVSVVVTAVTVVVGVNYRHRYGRTRTVCVPQTGVCIEA